MRKLRACCIHRLTGIVSNMSFFVCNAGWPVGYATSLSDPVDPFFYDLTFLVQSLQHSQALLTRVLHALYRLILLRQCTSNRRPTHLKFLAMCDKYCYSFSCVPNAEIGGQGLPQYGCRLPLLPTRAARVYYLPDLYVFVKA